MEEDRRKRMTPEQLRDEERRAAQGESTRRQEEDGEQAKRLKTTVAEAEEQLEYAKRKEKRKNAFAWNVYNDQTVYRSYKKREMQMVKKYGVVSNDDGPEGGAEYDPLNYADPEAYKPREDRVDALVEDLADTVRRRSEGSRLRSRHEEDDIGHINDRNKSYNDKVARSYDKYTAEIKSNLERGTAL